MATSESGINRQKSFRKYLPFFPPAFFIATQSQMIEILYQRAIPLCSLNLLESYWGKKSQSNEFKQNLIYLNIAHRLMFRKNKWDGSSSGKTNRAINGSLAKWKKQTKQEILSSPKKHNFPARMIVYLMKSFHLNCSSSRATGVLFFSILINRKSSLFSVFGDALERMASNIIQS